MPIVRSFRRLAGTAALALALTAGSVVATGAPAHAAGFPPVGSVVCHSSPVTGWQCGVVTAVNVTINHPGGVLYGLFRYQACASFRDGGAPVYQQSSGEQVGTVVGASGCQTYARPLP